MLLTLWQNKLECLECLFLAILRKVATHKSMTLSTIAGVVTSSTITKKVKTCDATQGATSSKIAKRAKTCDATHEVTSSTIAERVRKCDATHGVTLSAVTGVVTLSTVTPIVT